MSYNPNRASGSNTRKTARKYDPRTGHRRAKDNTPLGIAPSDLSLREVTNRGWRIPHFEGEEFEVVYELIAAGNSSGVIKNSESDRVIRVIRGHLFVLAGGETISLREGQVFSVEKGTEYEFASDMGSDVEVLFCQGRW